MTATALETIPTGWDDSRDTAFFRITAELFSVAFCSGASALLSSYDADESVGEAMSTTASTVTPPVVQKAGTTAGDRQLAPVPVRRRLG